MLGRSIVSVIDSGKFSPVPILVENKPGGGSTIGTTSVAQSKGNVHILLTFISGQVSAPIAAPPGIPPETVTFYETMMKRVSDSAMWKDKYLKHYMLSPAWMDSKEFTKFVIENESLFKGILTELGLVK